MTEDPYTRVIRKLGLGVHPGSPDDPKYPEPEYFLVGKREGLCPWCYSPIFDDNHLFPRTVLCNWEHGDSETENRIRYAAERLEDLWRDKPC